MPKEPPKTPKPPRRGPDAVQLPRYTKEEMIRIMIEKDPDLVVKKLQDLLKNK